MDSVNLNIEFLFYFEDAEVISKIEHLTKMGYRIKFWMLGLFTEYESFEIFEKVLRVGGTTIITDHIQLVSEFNAKNAKKSKE